ncbi:protocatechuate 3,4-dioxygenase subunit alpha [Nocardioides mangrovicus]|uniref:Protocatechuate 3,4-dioxygenase subunit alpha n=1 Tax=Nocardioides mangrovicus TaxID=2478913 RepID=A0A3L8NZX9_9ACTN|nr:protocatechuate 3,4-dioxygenase subunit alpha [Nocardioides mangrovicus]RLV48222.1 protocatechuate 3,4-dioxygenase subunit alpha [Nocardioides mangrovicus]
MTERTLPATPGQTVGPFFHYALPYPGDNELVPWGSPGSLTLRGRVYDGDGAPLPDALLEIRQAGIDGVVPQVPGSLRRYGVPFTGWGRCATDNAGEYRFSTVEPDASFIAVAVFARGLLDVLFTRIYLPGATDSFLDSLDTAERDRMTARREGDALVFDVRMQGEEQTVFLDFT